MFLFQITIEGVAKLLPNSSLTAGDIIPFYVTVEINGEEIFVSQIDITVDSTFTAKATVFIYLLDSGLTSL